MPVGKLSVDEKSFDWSHGRAVLDVPLSLSLSGRHSCEDRCGGQTASRATGMTTCWPATATRLPKQVERRGAGGERSQGRTGPRQGSEVGTDSTQIRVPFSLQAGDARRVC